MLGKFGGGGGGGLQLSGIYLVSVGLRFLVKDYVKSLKDHGELLDKLAWEDNSGNSNVSYLL